ncbi:MAG: hypothetical protein K9J37_05445 [Saprospiraceae bacterium]|nr:hypothetical protein [Saprospiraceae bacterium]MCF8249334.1 hypothetical protein [Saprospiraceae bacterium]MCF8279755.1 hypothetical protein [Bacteroidales bacterium]MCF8311389.1 hypothetical protein [Saprospiraceae bacterium]MCF8439953.1 hypothetical protein [Saprospiraceae bacterium]
MKYLSIALLLILIASCQSDKAREKAFAGRYQVTLHLPEATKEMEKAKKDVSKEISEAKKEIKDEIANAKEDIDAEMGEDSHLGNAVGNFVEGMGELAQGLAGLGESLGKMGIDLGRGIVEGLRFKAEFKEDGHVMFGKRSKIQVGSGEGNFWEIKSGKFYLWEDGDEKNAFEMKDLGDGNWDLVGEEVIFHLEKIE